MYVIKKCFVKVKSNMCFQCLCSFIYCKCYLCNIGADRSPISTNKDLSLLVVPNECLI